MRARRLPVTFALGAAAQLALVAPAVPAGADTPATPGCTTCTVTFDTVGTPFTFNVPANITSLSVTVAGAAGAAPNTSVLPGVGGTGGVTTVNLGTTYAGQTLNFGVGDTGEGSYVSTVTIDLLVVAGGGGGGGYVGRLDLPDQVFGTYPGGRGASPTVAGVTDGDDAEGYPGGEAANGGGGGATGGTGGNADSVGTNGGNTTITTPVGATLAAGGAGGPLIINQDQTPVEHVPGSGGGGITGGGGGAVIRGLPAGDDITYDYVAGGGGGAGYLAEGLTGSAAAEGNTGTGYVIFQYTVPALPSTGSALPGWVPIAAVLLLVAGGTAVVVTRRTRTN